MIPEEKAAYIISEAVDAYIETAGMVAANKNREYRGETPAYDEDAFEAVRRSHCVGHNSALVFLNRMD